jgi:hypothetical protein
MFISCIVLGHHLNIFLRSIKLNQHFPYIRQWFLPFFGSLLKKILFKKIFLASMKTLTNTETYTQSRRRIILWLTISVIGWFPPRDHL